MDSFLKGGEVMYKLQLDDVRWKSHAQWASHSLSSINLSDSSRG